MHYLKLIYLVILVFILVSTFFIIFSFYKKKSKVEQLSKKSLEGVKFCLSSISTVQYLSKNDTYVIGKKTKKKLLEVNSPWHYPILNSKGKFMCYRDGYNIINNFKINSFIQK